MENNITFNIQKHEYGLNGVPVPSVTQILKGVGLSNFDKVNPELLERNAAFGTAVHKAIELKHKGKLIESTVDEDIKGHIAQWEKFCQAFKYSPKDFEMRRVSLALRVGYTIDSVGDDTMADIKTGQPKVADVIQICAYGYMYPVRRLLIVYLGSEKYKVVEINSRDRKRFERVFLSSLSLFNFKKEYNLL